MLGIRNWEGITQESLQESIRCSKYYKEYADDKCFKIKEIYRNANGFICFSITNEDFNGLYSVKESVLSKMNAFELAETIVDALFN